MLYAGWVKNEENDNMLFAVRDLHSLSNRVQEMNAKKRKTVTTMLHRRQPEFCEIIDWVGMDPRCAQAHSFCTLFCGIALMDAEKAAGHRLPSYSGYAIQEMAGSIARGEEAQVGKRACGFRKRIANHVLSHYDFDNDDTEWLCTHISTFLFMIERSLKREKTDTDHPIRLLQRSAKSRAR